MKGEPRLVENTSYKGYSPPKCTCNVHLPFHNHIPIRTCQFYVESYMPCHEMRCDSSCTMCPSPHRLPHTTPKPRCKKPSVMPHFPGVPFTTFNHILQTYIAIVAIVSRVVTSLLIQTYIKIKNSNTCFTKYISKPQSGFLLKSGL